MAVDLAKSFISVVVWKNDQKQFTFTCIIPSVPHLSLRSILLWQQSAEIIDLLDIPQNITPFHYFVDTGADGKGK